MRIAIQKILTHEIRHGTASSQRPRPYLYLLVLPLALLIVPSVLLLAIYKQLVRLLLILRFGRKFGGLLNGPDMVWVVQEKEWRSVTTMVVMLESDTELDLTDKFKSACKQKIFGSKNYPKLTSTQHRFLGYVYMLKKNCTLDECVTSLVVPKNKPFDEGVLKDLTSDLSNKPLPKDDTTMWQVLISQVPLTQKYRGKFVYPLLIRYSHALGDGTTYVSFIIKEFCGDNVKTYLQDYLIQAYADAQARRSSMNWSNWVTLLSHKIRKLVHYFYVLYVTLGVTIFWQHVRNPDKHELHGPNLTGDKITAWSFEDKSELIPIIKRIKTRLPKGKFSDVVLTALSASFTDFYKRNGFNIPDYISLAVPVLVSYRHILSDGPTPLINKFGITGYVLPMAKSSLKDTLRQIADHSELTKTFPDVEVMMLLTQYISGVIPMPLLKKLFNVPGLTMVVSNVPGLTAAKILNEFKINHCVFFPLHRDKTGLAVGITTYDGLFHIGLMTDKALISTRDEAQRITDGVLKYIKQLDVDTST